MNPRAITKNTSTLSFLQVYRSFRPEIFFVSDGDSPRWAHMEKKTLGLEMGWEKHLGMTAFEE